jgi:enoyl-CoA hydratase/carnithine racemase
MHRLPDTLRCEIRDDVAVLTLGRPDRRNGLDDATVRGIRLFFEGLQPGTRAAIIAGDGAHLPPLPGTRET